MNRAVFLDRDNTIIHNDGDLGDPDQVKLIQGAASAIASLHGLGYKAVVITNQGGVARGKYTEADVDATHQRINQIIRNISGAFVDRFYYCPYHPKGTVPRYAMEHAWRKPAPGMLLQAIKDLDLDPTQCWMVGDQMRDVEAGKAAGVRTILLNPQAPDQPPLMQESMAASMYGRGTTEQSLPDFVARNLIEAVRIVAQQRRPEGMDTARWTEIQKHRVMPATATPDTPVDATSQTRPRAVPASKPAPPAVPPQAPPAMPSSSNGNETEASPSSTVSIVTQPSASELPASPVPSKPTASIAAPAPKQADTPAAATDRSTISASDQGGVAMPLMLSGPDTAGRPAPPPAELTLRQILQELRNQRPEHNDFSYQSLLAIVLQAVAGVCLLTGLALGRGNATFFFQCLAVALLLQTAMIGVLLLGRR